MVIVAVVVVNKTRRVLKAAEASQRNRNKARVQRAIQSCSVLRHPAIFVPFDKLRALGKFTSHEVARDAGDLTVVDTYAQLVDFTRAHATVFVCGEANMAAAVAEALEKVLGAAAYAALHESGCYHEEIFGASKR